MNNQLISQALERSSTLFNDHQNSENQNIFNLQNLNLNIIINVKKKKNRSKSLVSSKKDGSYFGEVKSTNRNIIVFFFKKNAFKFEKKKGTMI